MFNPLEKHTFVACSDEPYILTETVSTFITTICTVAGNRETGII